VEGAPLIEKERMEGLARLAEEAGCKVAWSGVTRSADA